MDDTKKTIQDIKNQARTFVVERSWDRFHTPKNMSMALAAEAAELMEHFLWVESADSANHLEKNRIAIENEVADIAMALMNFCTENGIDLSRAVERKLAEITVRYPVDQVKDLQADEMLAFKEQQRKKSYHQG